MAFVSGASGEIAALEAAKALQGQLVLIADPNGVYWHNCRVISVSIGSVAPCLHGGSAMIRLELVYSVEMESSETESS